ncbi:MAG: hypothetical protein HW405_686 [Candidatus Berkelbacteria bacterium]|nr:hypothetical protein [Candidatus Berkelbacteria bacterium]
MAISVAPTLPEVVVAMGNASDEELHDWGLKALTQVIPAEENVRASFDLVCSDGSVFTDVRPASGSAPKAGKILAFYSDGYQYAPFPITKVEGNQVYTSAPSSFMQGLDYRDLLPEWVVEASVFTKWSTVRLDAEQERNLATFPEEIREPMRQMAQAESPVKHLRAPYCHNRGELQKLWREYQLFCQQHKTYVNAPTAFVPVSRAKEVRVIMLSAGGRPYVMLGSPERTEATYKGIFSFGVILRNPDRTTNQGGSAEANSAAASSSSSESNATNNNSNTIGIDVDQQQQQQ